MSRPRVTKRRLENVKATAKREMGLLLPDDVARKIVQWDDEDGFLPELQASGHLDTAPRDYFAMAVVESLITTPPTVEDSFPFQRPVWHWPAFGSTEEYKKAFYKEFAKAAKAAGVKLTKRGRG